MYKIIIHFSFLSGFLPPQGWCQTNHVIQRPQATSETPDTPQSLTRVKLWQIFIHLGYVGAWLYRTVIVFMQEIIKVMIVINNRSVLLLSINLCNVRLVTDLFQRNMWYRMRDWEVSIIREFGNSYQALMSSKYGGTIKCLSAATRPVQTILLTKHETY